eukprot:380673_1
MALDIKAPAYIQMQMCIWGYLRENIEDEFKYLIIPNEIKLVLLKYTGNLLIDSLILTNEEKYTIQSLLNKKWNTEFIEFNLVWRGSRDGFGCSSFYSNCNVTNTLCVIEATQNDTTNVFGGYTQLKWDSLKNNEYGKDKNAFLFLIRSSSGYPAEIFDILPNQTHCAIQNSKEDGYICCFGAVANESSNEIFISEDKGFYTTCENGDTYDVPSEKGNRYLLGNNSLSGPSRSSRFAAKEIEMFQISFPKYHS